MPADSEVDSITLLLGAVAVESTDRFSFQDLPGAMGILVE
jgi:hypothetical protein